MHDFDSMVNEFLLSVFPKYYGYKRLYWLKCLRFAYF